MAQERDFVLSTACQSTMSQEVEAADFAPQRRSFIMTKGAVGPDGLMIPLWMAAVIRAVQMTVGEVVGWYRQILDDSFSSVSRPIFASK